MGNRSTRGNNFSGQSRQTQPTYSVEDGIELRPYYWTANSLMIAPGSRVLHGICSFILIDALFSLGKAEFAMELVAHLCKLE